MYRNVGLIKGAVDSIAVYSVGPGLRPQYRGVDVGFGKLAEQYWRDVVAPNPEVTGRMTWTDLLLALSRSIDVDGDVFVIMTDKGKLQVVEGHRVCEGDNYESTDGVFLGKMGEPTAYLLELGETYRKINADLVIHLMEMERPDQIRGGSNLARALNHVRDLKLLGEFEKDALKLQGSIAAVITSNEGDALAGSGGFFGNIATADLGDTSIAREQITSSATIPRLAPGEKIEMVAPNRPNNGFEPFAKFLIRDVAMGLGLPIEFVYDPASVGGAGMRFIVAKAQRRFEQRQRLLIDRFCNRSWSYFIGRAIANGDLPPAEDYRKVSWQTPKSLTVDAGREEMQARESYKAGLISLQTYHGELGEDWVEQVDQIKAEQTYMSGGTEVSQAPLITKIGDQGARSITAILQSIGMGQITPEQAEVILVTVYGLNKEDAAKIARGGSSPSLKPTDAPITSAPDEAPIPEEPKADATATDTTTPTDIVTDVPENNPPDQLAAPSFIMPDDAPDFNLSAKELNMIVTALGIGKTKAKKKK
jgi:lambda family phage portal protein